MVFLYSLRGLLKDVERELEEEFEDDEEQDRFFVEDFQVNQLVKVETTN